MKYAISIWKNRENVIEQRETHVEQWNATFAHALKKKIKLNSIVLRWNDVWQPTALFAHTVHTFVFSQPLLAASLSPPLAKLVERSPNATLLSFDSISNGEKTNYRKKRTNNSSNCCRLSPNQISFATCVFSWIHIRWTYCCVSELNDGWVHEKRKKKKRLEEGAQCTCIWMCSDWRRQHRMNIRLIFSSPFLMLKRELKKNCSSTLGKDIYCLLYENIAHATEHSVFVLVPIQFMHTQRLALNMCKYLQMLFTKFRASRAQGSFCQPYLAGLKMLTEINAYIS